MGTVLLPGPEPDNTTITTSVFLEQLLCICMVTTKRQVGRGSWKLFRFFIGRKFGGRYYNQKTRPVECHASQRLDCFFQGQRKRKLVSQILAATHRRNMLRGNQGSILKDAKCI